MHSDTHERSPEQQQETNNGPVNIQDANPAHIQLETRDLGAIQLAYSTGLYDLQAHTGQPTYVLFGGWQTEQQLGFIAAIHAGGETEVRISTEDRDGKDIQTELSDRIAQAIEHSQTHEQTNHPDTDGENQANPDHHQPAQDHQPEIEHALEPQQDPDRDKDLSFGIE